MNSSILLVKKREGKIAPFINGYNVWDLEPKEWTINVQKAILHSYELGKQHAVMETRSNVDTNFRLDARFPEPIEV